MRKLPYSQDAEMALLGTLMVFPESVHAVQEYNLQVDDFYNTEHQRIFSHMLEIIETGRILDATTLISRMKDHNEIDSVGGMDYLFSLTQNSAAPVSLKHYIEVVQEKAQIRRLIAVGQMISEKGFDTSTNLDALLDLAESSVLEVTRVRRTEDMQKSKDVVAEFLENLRRIQENKDRITGLKTGYNSLNSLMNGLQRGDLIILAARPSVGKTAFALNLGLNVARHNDSGKAGVAIFSLEMPATHLMSRMIAAQSSVKSEFLKTGYLNDDQSNQLHMAAGVLSQTNIFIDDSSTVTIPEIFSKCRKLKAEGTLDLIIIDYIQLISGRGNTESRQQEVSEISRGLKQLAREMNVPVIALSQLSRNVEKRDVKIPQLSDLRESGSIEQDADIVMFLYREEYYNRNNEDNDEPKPQQNDDGTQEVLVKIAKHRQGALADVYMRFDPTISKFYDVANER
ncbi:replicative DNA helicase [Erysipelothrix inopinata]|uniref:Replicative DNA helicase n=1 Tax=Erysipelothrix inopinata TaxID=225084 RepID=A0A7G9S0Q8_9FIRM|nr:replicative DNA helicase [Erysipelothrix inopinata]QNN61433.1 replicative DNA helicase [Erysipelothrix inopinata]